MLFYQGFALDNYFIAIEFGLLFWVVCHNSIMKRNGSIIEREEIGEIEMHQRGTIHTFKRLYFKQNYLDI